MKTIIPTRHAAFGALALLIGLTVSACSAVPNAAPTSAPTPTASEQPVQAVVLAEGSQDAPVQISVAGDEGVGVTFREITLAPGASTGEHCHYGQLIAVVAEGALTHYAEMYPGGVHVYNTGDSIIEGAGYPHEGRNEGDTNVVLWVTYLIPEGKPLAETVLSNCG